MERRIRGLEQRFGPVPDPGRLAIISPNAWDDRDRDAWQRCEILNDTAGKDTLIERNSGHRPVRRPGMVAVVIVPAPDSIEQADEQTRREWRERMRSRHPWGD